MFSFASSDRGYAAAATNSDGEPRLSVEPESVSNHKDGRGFVFRYITGPGSPKKSGVLFGFPQFSLALSLPTTAHFPTLLEKIHPNELNARIFSVPVPLFLDRAIGHGNIAKHPHVQSSNFKPLKFVMEGFEIV
jgi:hypothetical protein